MENEFLGNLNPHFYDPVKLAEFIMSGYVNNDGLKDTLPLPSALEIEEWGLTPSEMTRCADEFYILMVAGDSVTVKRNKSFEFYSSFLRAIAPRLNNMLYGQQSITASEEMIKVIERYIELLDTEQMVAFACTYTERVFDGNPNEGKIFEANLWQKPFDMMMKTMSATKDMFIGCIADEEECRLLGEGIAITKHEVVQLRKRMNDGAEDHPAQKIESLLNDINMYWGSAKLEDNETKVFVLHDCWYELKHLYISTLSDDELSKFTEPFFHQYMAQLLSMSSLITQTGDQPSGSLPVDRMLRVTEREISLGRLTDDAPIRQNALKAKAEGKTDLIMDDIREHLRQNPINKIVDTFSKLKKIRSFLRIFGI